MQSLEQKVKKYKRGTIEQFKPFFNKGQITAWEIEFIANGAVVSSLDTIRSL